jgi:iron-sulfur cluster assembly protein
MSKNLVTISNTALNKMKNILQETKSKYILFSVQSGGCNGIQYDIKPHNQFEKLNELVKYNDIELQVCNKSLLYLLGTHIDWKKDYIGERFVFENPNATSNCGCGTTFSID